MKTFNAETDSFLLTKWYLDLCSDPVEFANLMCKPLRNLAKISVWVTHTVKLFYESDAQGMWFCAWVVPYMTGGVEVGAWIRKDRRGSKPALKAIDHFYDEIVLPKASCAIGLTKQRGLHDLHIKLGYTYVDEFPGVFDGDSVFVYKMTKESRANRHAVAASLRAERRAHRVNVQRDRRERIEESDQPEQHESESLRGESGSVREARPESSRTRYARVVESGKRSIAEWWRNGSHSDPQSSD